MINDKHIELIIRQMLKKYVLLVQVIPTLFVGDRVDKNHFQKVNEIMIG